MDCDGQIGQLRLGLFENVDETIEGFAESGLCRPKPVAGLAKDGDVGPVGLVHGQGHPVEVLRILLKTVGLVGIAKLLSFCLRVKVVGANIGFKASLPEGVWDGG